MATVQPAEQSTSWAPPLSLAWNTELVDRSRAFWGEGGQFVPNTIATGEFNDPYDDIHYFLQVDAGASKGHFGKLLEKEHRLVMENAQAVGSNAQAWFEAIGFDKVSKFGRFLVPENVSALTITDVVTQRVARIGRTAILSALPAKTPEEAPAPFVTVSSKLVLRTTDADKPKRVEVFQGEPVHPSRIYAWSLLRNAVAIEYAD